MRDQINSKIRFVYDKAEGYIAPMDWQPHCPQPPTGSTSVRVTGAVNNYNGLQILMLDINGKTLRPDGIPYHMIWSRHRARDEILQRDENHVWPVSVIEGTPDKGAMLGDIFSGCTFYQTHIPTRRVLSDVDLEAEALAAQCDFDRFNGIVRSNSYDFVPCAIKLHFPSFRWPPFRVAHFETGTRQMADVDLYPTLE